MKIQLEHPAIKTLEKLWDCLLIGCKKLSTFVSKINSISKKIKDGEREHPYPLLDQDNAANKFKGDVFEIFSEVLIRLSPIDERIGVSDYHVITENDTGVDGWGIGRDGKIVTVQIKYRLWDYELDQIREHLDNFRFTSYCYPYLVDPKEIGRMLIITTGKGINWRTLNQFNGAVRCISRGASYGCLKGGQMKNIDSLFSLETLTNNPAFWKAFIYMVSERINDA